MHPADRDQVMERFFELIDQPETVVEDVTYRFRHADGSWVWLESSAVNKSSSAAGGYVINSRDISKRVRREQELQERVKELNAIRRTVELWEQHPEDTTELLEALVHDLPDSFQYPEYTEVRVTYGPVTKSSGAFEQTQNRIEAVRETNIGASLRLAVGIQEVDSEWQPGFIDEERELLQTVVGFLRQYFDRQEHLSELERTRERYEQILRHLSDYVTIVDGNGEITYVSPAVEEVANFEPTEVIGTSALEYVLDADHEEAAAAFSEPITNPDKEVNVEYRIQTADGSVRWVEARGSNYLDDPVLEGILVAVRDITERKERERRYEAIFNQTYQFTGLLEPDGTFVEVNQPALDFGNLDRDEVIGTKMWDAPSFRHSEETKDRAREAVMQAAQGDFVRHELPVQGAEGDEVIIDFSVRPVIDEDGDVILLVPEGRDITELKQREEELRRERDRFQMAFDTVPEPVVHVVFEGNDPIVRRVNDAFAETFGYAQEEARGQSLDSLIIPGDRLDEACEINRQVREETRIEEEIVRETPEGEKQFLFTAKTMSLGEGQLEGIGTYVDLTEQKRRERELVRQNERLDRFASLVSHDLRNPLNVATGRLALATEECDSSHLEDVANAHERMEALIDDLLQLARQGQPVGDFEALSVPDLVESCWSTVETKEATMRMETSNTIRADRSRLRQLFENLTRNAVEHGGRAVSLTVGDLETGFYLEDDGVGIPESEREDVFNAGYSSTEDGTGFGLAIVKEIVDAHGWKIEVTESDAGGARFEITGVELVD